MFYSIAVCVCVCLTVSCLVTGCQYGIYQGSVHNVISWFVGDGLLEEAYGVTPPHARLAAVMCGRGSAGRRGRREWQTVTPAIPAGLICRGDGGDGRQRGLS